MLNAKLSTIMSDNVITVSPKDNMEKVDDLFSSHNIHHLPVVNDLGKVVGMVSKSDYLLLCDSMTKFSKQVGHEKNKRLFSAMLVEDVMTKQLATLKASNTVGLAVGFFRENIFHAIPILDEEDKLVGIVTTFDMLNFAFQEPSSLE